MQTNKLKEWIVPCEWCGAEAGKPCVNNISGKIIEVYKNHVHIARQREYDNNRLNNETQAQKK